MEERQSAKENELIDRVEEIPPKLRLADAWPHMTRADRAEARRRAKEDRGNGDNDGTFSMDAICKTLMRA